MKDVYTIGYGNRNIELFINILSNNNIDILVDIRSNPVSRFSPNYSKTRIATYMQNNAKNYIFLGTELGGKPKNENLYTNGKLDYELVKKDEKYLSGINQLIELVGTQKRICLMCCELNPLNCHRYTLVGNSLHDLGYNVLHINENGLNTSHSELSKQVELF